jgi:hypothetical protein
MVPMNLRTALAAFLSLIAAAACAGPAAARDHGRVVAHLAIPYRPAAVTGKTEVIRVAVRSGQRFSIRIDTSDGPFYWNQTGRPDSRVVRLAGDFNEGSCASGMVGCRVPYFHTLVARARGTATMSWRYHDLRCQALRKRMTQATRSCPSVTVVTFDITVR